MRYAKVFLFILLISHSGWLRAQDTLSLSEKEYESLFLSQNLLLIAEKLEISRAEAAVQQARLWPNPTFTLDQVNLWATKGQTGGQEVVPPLFGSFGKNQQFGAELEQVILTARKRSKLVALEQANVEKSVSYFQELLRTLKFEFRKNLFQLRHLQQTRTIYEKQLEAISQLVAAIQRQVNDGHLPKSELIRLRARELEVKQDLTLLNERLNQVQKELRVWMHLPPDTQLQLVEPEPIDISKKLAQLNLTQLIENAQHERPDLQAAHKAELFAQRQLDLERARRVPNVTVKGAYDRNGNAMLNFIGFGASIDLPFFDRNQGNVRRARYEVDQVKTMVKLQESKVENEVVLAFRNLQNSLTLASDLEPEYENSLDEMLDAYTRNFSSRTISMLEYLDYLEAWEGNKRIILETQKSVREKAEELQYTVGRDIF